MRTLVQLVACLILGALLALIGLGMWSLGWWNLVVLGVVFVPLLFWVMASIKEVKPNQLAILVMWSKLVDEIEPGIYFIPWCFGWNRIEFFPTTLWDITFPVVEVLTKAGKFPDDATGKEYGRAPAKVIAVGYFRLPKRREMLVKKTTGDFVAFTGQLSDAQKLLLERNGEVTLDGEVVVLEKEHPIVSIWKTGVPLTKSRLLDFATESVTGSIRLAVSRMTWGEANVNLEGIQKTVEEGFKKSDGALIVAGFRPSGIKISISSVDIPQGVKDAMARKEAAEDSVQADAKEASVTPVAYNNWLETEAGKNATQSQRDEMLRILSKQALSDDGHYTEAQNSVTIKGLENATTVIIGESGAGLLLGGGGSGKGDKKTEGRKKASEMTPEELKKHIADM